MYGDYCFNAPRYTYIKKTKEVVDYSGVVVDKCETEEEFIKDFPHGVIYDENYIGD